MLGRKDDQTVPICREALLMPVASKIEEFLRNAPPGRLYVVVGYADVTRGWRGWSGMPPSGR